MINLNENAAFWYSGHTATAIIAEPTLMGLNSWSLPNGSLGVGHPNTEALTRDTWPAISSMRPLPTT